MASTQTTCIPLIGVLSALRWQIRKHGSAAALAAQAGLSRSYVCDVLRRVREPGPRLLDYLGFEKKVERIVTYKWKGKRPR
jgi:hypothetical protein